MSKSIKDRLGWLFEGRQPSPPRVQQPIDAVADVRMQDAIPLNGGSCVAEDGLKVTTDPGCGGYSALIPVDQSHRYSGPALYRCDCDIQEGAVGLSAVTADCGIIAERVATKPGRQHLDIIVPDLRDVAGILVRNLAATGRRSRVVLRAISAGSYPAEMLLRIRAVRPSRMLRLPLRTQLDEPERETSRPVTTMVDLDTGATAAIIVDAWQGLEHRVTENIADNLAPTLNALRSTGMAILHAAHDREVHPLARPLAGETEVAGEFHDAGAIARTLSDAGIQSLIYLGYFSNMCILRRSTGMIEMQKRGFKTILVRDASAAKESEASMAGGEFHAAMVHFIELNLGATITAAEVQAAISACSSAEDAKAAAGSVVKVPNA